MDHNKCRRRESGTRRRKGIRDGKDEVRKIRKVGRNEERKNRIRVGGDTTKYWRREKNRS